MTVTDHVLWQGLEILHTWETGTAPPAGLPVRQVSGVCFTETSFTGANFTGAGAVVLVSTDGHAWTLPGGHPEGAEMPEQTLAREVLEEACAEVLACTLIGWQRVDDPREPPYLQLRYAARVRPDDFLPRHETLHRRLVSRQEVLSILSWGQSPIAAELLRVASEADLP